MESFKICAACGSVFSGEKWHIKKRKFCSSKCYVSTKISNLAGKVFGRLTVIGYVGNGKWETHCQCGSTQSTTTQNLSSGKTKSCGCLQRELAKKAKTTHGGKGTKAHSIWQGIVQRCKNPNTKQWKDYGGRGITLCQEWETYEGFVLDMGQPPAGHCIERVNNAIGYTKENCKWATRKEQQNNRRNTTVLSYLGEKKTLIDWADIAGITTGTLRSRISNSWPVEEALGFKQRQRKSKENNPNTNSIWVSFGGETRYLADWCRKLGLNGKTVGSRIARGASPIKALGLY